MTNINWGWDANAAAGTVSTRYVTMTTRSRDWQDASQVSHQQTHDWWWFSKGGGRKQQKSLLTIYVFVSHIYLHFWLLLRRSSRDLHPLLFVPMRQIIGRQHPDQHSAHQRPFGGARCSSSCMSSCFRWKRYILCGFVHENVKFSMALPGCNMSLSQSDLSGRFCADGSLTHHCLSDCVTSVNVHQLQRWVLSWCHCCCLAPILLLMTEYHQDINWTEVKRPSWCGLCSGWSESP